MSPQLTKRALLRKGPLSAGVGLGTLALLTQSASSDTPFTAFAFPATGAPTPRTLPDRLAEVVNVKDFGAVGDGAHDDTTNIQAAIDHAISHHRYTVHMPEGNYKTTNTIHLGYGDAFSAIELRGASSSAIAMDNPPATTIYPTFRDRPVINVAGARGSRVSFISISVPNYIDNSFASLATRANGANWVPNGFKDHSSVWLNFSGQPDAGSTLTFNGTVVTFGDGTGGTVNRGASLANAVDDLVAFINNSADAQLTKLDCTAYGAPHNKIGVVSNVVDNVNYTVSSGAGSNASFSAPRLMIYTPFCGFCVDGWAGATPPNPYPDIPWPAWIAPGTPSYGSKALSSVVVFNHCGASNTNVGFMIQPNDDGNGDFMRWINCSTGYMKVGIAWGNSQARSNDLQNFFAGAVHTVFNGTDYGHGVGNLAGNYNNISLGWCYRIITTAEGWVMPIFISNMYQEGGNIIGDAAGLEFHACTFQYMSDARYGGGGKLIEVYRDVMFKGGARFVNCGFTGRSAFHFMGDCRFEACGFGYDCLTANAPTMIAANPPAMQKCCDAFGQLFIAAANRSPGPWRTGRSGYIGFRQNHAASSQAAYFGYDGSSSVNMYGFGAEVRELYGGLFVDYDVVSRFGSMPFANMALNGRTLTFDGFAAGYFQPGDAIWSIYSGVWWYVDNQSVNPPYTVTAYPLTDVKWDGANWKFLVGDPANPSGGFFWWPIGVLDLDPGDADPNNGLFMVTTAGNSTINFVDGAGNPANRPTRCTVNSRPLWFGKNHQITGNTVPFPQNTMPIAAPSATSLQMSAAALVTGTWLYCPGIKRIK
jgi:Pectate lyase superfamily protein